MTLAERIAARILSHERLRGVPAPIVEEVLAQGFRALAEIVPMKTPASEIDAIEFDACEGCGHLIDAAEPEGAQMDPEGIWLCNACVVEEAAASPPDDRGSDTGEGA